MEKLNITSQPYGLAKKTHSYTVWETLGSGEILVKQDKFKRSFCVVSKCKGFITWVFSGDENTPLVNMRGRTDKVHQIEEI